MALITLYRKKMTINGSKRIKKYMAVWFLRVNNYVFIALDWIVF